MKRFLYTGLLLIAAACTQEAAQVDYKGDAFYGNVPDSAFHTSNHDAFTPTIVPRGPVTQQPPANVPAVGVSDLAPPVAQPSPFKPASKPLEPAKVQEGAKFIWPVSDGKMLLRFGPKQGGRSNDGINVGLAEGEPIWAAAAGTVVYAGSDLKGYGNMVIIRHAGGWMTAYAHARNIAVKKNDTVKQGDIIGYVGMTGGVKSPQLHFAIREGKTPVDPELYLPKR